MPVRCCVNVDHDKPLNLRGSAHAVLGSARGSCHRLRSVRFFACAFVCLGKKNRKFRAIFQGILQMLRALQALQCSARPTFATRQMAFEMRNAQHFELSEVDIASGHKQKITGLKTKLELEPSRTSLMSSCRARYDAGPR